MIKNRVLQFTIRFFSRSAMSKRACDVYTRARVALTRVRAIEDRFCVPNLVKLQSFYDDSSQTNGKMCSLFNSRIFTTKLQGNV